MIVEIDRFGLRKSAASASTAWPGWLRQHRTPNQSKHQSDQSPSHGYVHVRTCSARTKSRGGLGSERHRFDIRFRFVFRTKSKEWSQRQYSCSIQS